MAHANVAVIDRFYTAFANLDAATMATCYAPNVQFRDEVFELDGRDQTVGMWTMLTEATKKGAPADWKLVHSAVTADETSGAAHWDANYRFSATNRLVLNRIDAKFEFANGLIVRHTDSFDFHTWAKQALGTPGLLLGWTGFLRNKVRAQAGANLAKFMQSRR